MKELINFALICPTPNPTIQIVNQFSVFPDQDTGAPANFTFNIALDRTKANSKFCEFPLYIPAHMNYHSPDHYKLLKTFRAGAPFVPIKCQNLRIYRDLQKNNYKYWGYADSFTVAEYSEIAED